MPLLEAQSPGRELPPGLSAPGRESPVCLSTQARKLLDAAEGPGHRDASDLPGRGLGPKCDVLGSPRPCGSK